jgi:CCR4-NOT complex subunit CAF16
MENPERPGSKLLELALAWLEGDREARMSREVKENGRRKRGAQLGEEGKVTDSEQFYRK